MTNRYKGIVVTLMPSIREDDAEPILAAIRQLKYVISAEPLVEDLTHLIAYRQVLHGLREKLWAVLQEEKK